MRQLFFLMLFCTERVLSTHPQEAGTGGVGERHGAAREHETQMKTAAAADAASAGSRPVTTGEALKSESSASLPLEKRLDHVEEATARGDERLRGGPREESRRCAGSRAAGWRRRRAPTELRWPGEVSRGEARPRPRGLPPWYRDPGRTNYGHE